MLILEPSAIYVMTLVDAGTPDTPDSLLHAAAFVQTIQSRTGMIVGS